MCKILNFRPPEPAEAAADRERFREFVGGFLPMLNELVEFSRCDISYSTEFDKDDAETAAKVNAFLALRNTRDALKALAELAESWWIWMWMGDRDLHALGYDDPAMERDWGKQLVEEFLPQFRERMK